MGIEIRDVKGRKRMSHGGGIEGLNTDMAYYPDQAISIIVLGNLNGPGPDDVSRMLGAVAHGDPVTLMSERREVFVAPEALSAYTGTYELNPNFTVTITVENNQLRLQAAKQPKHALFAEAENKFFLKVVDAQVEFFKDASGAVTHMVLFQNGREMKGVRK